jgi:isopropylmalate/homocitrate/citramalate synthase
MTSRATLPSRVRLVEVAVFVAASETFSRKNINGGIAESLERTRPLYAAAKARDIRVRGYIARVLGCPHEVSLRDTIGVGAAGATASLIARPGSA